MGLAIHCTDFSEMTKMFQAVNTHFLHKEKFHCTADLLLYWLGFSCFAYVELDRDLQVWLNPDQPNRRSAIQWYFILQSKWVFSVSGMQLLSKRRWRFIHIWPSGILLCLWDGEKHNKIRFDDWAEISLHLQFTRRRKCVIFVLGYSVAYTK